MNSQRCGRRDSIDDRAHHAPARPRRAGPGLTHIAIVEPLDGRSTVWLEQVSDEQYGARVVVRDEALPSPERGAHDSFAFAIDPRGRLAWESNDIDGDHVVAVLPERVSDEYLAFLRERGVSYLLAGARNVDLQRALEKIGARFGVRTLML